MADYIRTHKELPKTSEKYIFTEPSDYPPLLRIVIAFLPKGTADRYQWMISPAFDMMHSLTLFFSGWVLTTSVYGGLIAQATYILSPLVVMENCNLTTRSFASFLSSLTFFLFILFLAHGSYWTLTLGLMFGILLIMAHRFSLQAFIFYTIGLIIFEKSILPLFFLITCLGGAILLTRGYSWRVLTGHVQMLEYWRRNISNRYAHQVRGLPNKSTEDGKKNDSGDIVFKIYSYVQKLPLIAILAANPSSVVPLLVAVLALTGVVPLHNAGLELTIWQLLVLWSTCLTVVGIIIRQIRFFEFIGEGERYQDSGIFPSALVTAQLSLHLIGQGHTAAVLAGLISLWTVSLGMSLYLQWKVVYKDNDRSIKKELWEVFRLIDEQSGEVRLMSIPLLLADSAVYFSKAKVLSTDSSVAHLKHYDDFFPVLKKPLNQILKQYSITHLLVNSGYAELKELNLNPEYQILHSEKFCLLRIK
ncbi:MAG: hypothetical protein NPINA01_02970 [Nitrospinaceae bacterium]|nr:MAG: hypothetical protein NPINA01_02970 [Nitrospinaceae bacterium]